MLKIFTYVFLFLIRIRFPPKKGFINIMHSRYGSESLKHYRKLEKLDFKCKKTLLDLDFLDTCKRYEIIPKFLKFKVYNRSFASTFAYKSFQFQMLNFEIKRKQKHLKSLVKTHDSTLLKFKNSVNSFDFWILSTRLNHNNDNKIEKAKLIHVKKLTALSIPPTPKLDQKKVITNLSKRKLTPAEAEVLSLGPSFALPNSKAKFVEHYLAFEKTLQSLKQTKISPESNLSWDDISHSISGIAHTSFTEHSNSKHIFPKLKPSQYQALKDLQSDDTITISRPDKGKGIVIMDKTEYIEKVNLILNDPSKFKALEDDPFVLITKAEDKLQRFLRTLLKEKIINKESYRFLFASGSSAGVLYGLPKIHKAGNPLRPILSAIGTYNYNLAKFLVPIIEPLTQNEYTVTNSYEFVSDLKNINLQQFTMCSFDVESLFTNIPLDETIEVIAEDLFKDVEKVNNFNKDQFIQLLNFAMKDSPFIFNNNLYIQQDGVAMGSPLAPTFANAFLGHYEKIWLEQCPPSFKPLVYKRYVDDTFLLFNNPEQIPKFLAYLNSKHNNIKFTVELENNNSLPFLDILLTRDGNQISTSVFRKPTFTGLGTNFLSFIPEQFKINSIQTLLFRAYNISSNWQLFHKEIEFLKTYFLTNGYPPNIFYKTLRNFLNNLHNKTSLPKENKPTIRYICLPYYGLLSFHIRKNLNKILKSGYPDIRFRYIFTNPCTIGSRFRHKEQLPPNLTSNVVYIFKCLRCKMQYIGETQRNLSLRIPEHLGISPRSGEPLSKPSHSPIRLHATQLQHPCNKGDFKLLHKAKNSMDLPILESLYIKHLSPELNSNLSSYPLLTFK